MNKTDLGRVSCKLTRPILIAFKVKSQIILHQSPTALLRVATTKSQFSKEMLTATEILSVFVTAFYICFQTNISILQQNKRQFNLLPLVNIIFPFFRVTPTIDIEPIFDNKLVL